MPISRLQFPVNVVIPYQTFSNMIVRFITRVYNKPVFLINRHGYIPSARMKRASSQIVFKNGLRNVSFIQRCQCSTEAFMTPKIQLDEDFFNNPANSEKIKANTHRRLKVDTNEIAGNREAQLLLPNMTHPEVNTGDITKARVIDIVSDQKVFPFKPKGVLEIGENLRMLRTQNVGDSSGSRTYYFTDALANLERALILYTTSTLTKQGFQLISVPDLIHPKIIEGCGFPSAGERTQVYRLDDGSGNTCLAGTGEMPIAGYFINKVYRQDDLPLRFMAVSRCYRAETSNIEEEKGIYRVHQFNKVEMFGITCNEETAKSSQELMDLFLNTQRELFTSLDLHFRILDMPTEELGAPAYRKYDIEAFLPARNMWGEISSTSNCTDYQSRRLNIKYIDNEGNTKFCHTVNGTACAVPRMQMAIVENNQNEFGDVEIPIKLYQYFGGRKMIEQSKTPVPAKWIKLTRAFKKMKQDSSS